MKINLSNLFNSQKELDHCIQGQHNVTYAKVINELKLALLVELAEFANEIKCFKFWSVKGPSPKDVILEEYVDGIHFITSLSIYYGCKHIFNVKSPKTKCNDKKALTKNLISLFKAATNINNKASAEKWYIQYLEFGFKIGFKIKEILNAYNRKNQINHQRQKDNY